MTEDTASEVLHPFQVMPALSDEGEAALTESITRHGVLTPIVVDEAGDIIDGYNRERIAARLGKFCPRRTARDLTDAEKIAMALTLNIDRRHLTREQKRELLAKSIKAEPELSNSQHAKRTGTSDKTAASVRTDLEGCSEIPNVEKRTDTAGRAQPAKRPVKPAKGCTLPAEIIERDRQLSGRHTEPEPVDDDTEDEPAEPVLDDFELFFPNNEAAYMHVYFGTRVAAVTFGDPLPNEITPAVAAELAERIQAVMPQIIKLGTQLERRGREAAGDDH